MSTGNSGAQRKFSEAITAGQHLQLSFPATVQSFCRDLSRPISQTVLDTVSEISRLRQQMIVNMLAIGEHLSKLRSAVGAEKFSQFVREILPTLGVSRSTAYRWLSVAERLASIFPNPLIREQLMTLTDGRGIVASAGKGHQREFGEFVLTPAAEAALKTLPPAPTSKHGPADSEQWVRLFIKTTAKARAQVRVGGRNLAKDEGAIVRKFMRFAEYYGPVAAEDLCGQLDKALNRIVESTPFRPRRVALQS